MPFDTVPMHAVHFGSPWDVDHDVPLARSDDEVGRVAHRLSGGRGKLVHPWKTFFVHRQRERFHCFNYLNGHTKGEHTKNAGAYAASKQPGQDETTLTTRIITRHEIATTPRMVVLKAIMSTSFKNTKLDF